MEEDTDTPEEAEQKEMQLRIFMSEVFRQVSNYPRFTAFFEANYEVVTTVNDEEETFDVTVMERPFEVANARFQQMLEDHSKKHMPAIVPATEADLKNITTKGKRR